MPNALTRTHALFLSVLLIVVSWRFSFMHSYISSRTHTIQIHLKWILQCQIINSTAKRDSMIYLLIFCIVIRHKVGWLNASILVEWFCNVRNKNRVTTFLQSNFSVIFESTKFKCNYFVSKVLNSNIRANYRLQPTFTLIFLKMAKGLLSVHCGDLIGCLAT